VTALGAELIYADVLSVSRRRRV